MIKRRELIAKGINQLMNDLITGKPKNEPQNLDGYLIPGENELVEFKSTLRWDLVLEQPNKKLEWVITKTISAFMNTHSGVLIIGVADDGKLIGLEPDLKH